MLLLCHQDDGLKKSENESDLAAPVKFRRFSLPDFTTTKFCREFSLSEFANLEVTSLDITPHGCYVIAGCGNGMIILFDMTSSYQHGFVVGHIRAKGLHTSLLLSVHVSDDSRFCFAGVMKGSSELVAVDLGGLPCAWSNIGGRKHGSGDFGEFPIELIKNYNHCDPKLRGFCAAVLLSSPSSSKSCLDEDASPVTFPAVYRLACGRGIKNVHVWQFEPDCFVYDNASNTSIRQPKWTCLYDVASNGNTIETIAFRHHGHQVLSKSAGVPLRVWTLSSNYMDCGSDSTGTGNDSADTKGVACLPTPLDKPTYEDIANSHDMKAIFDGVAIGGSFDFARVQIEAPKSANRDSLEMPERNDDENNNGDSLGGSGTASNSSSNNNGGRRRR